MPHKSDKKLWSRGEACHLGAISLRSAQCWYVKTFLLGWLDSSEENLLTFSLDGGKRVTICSAAELEKPFVSGWTQYIKCSSDPPVCRLVPLSPHPTPTSAPLPPGPTVAVQLSTDAGDTVTCLDLGKGSATYLLLKREFQLIFLFLASPLSSYLEPNLVVPLGEVCGLLCKLAVSKT